MDFLLYNRSLETICLFPFSDKGLKITWRQGKTSKWRFLPILLVLESTQSAVNTEEKGEMTDANYSQESCEVIVMENVEIDSEGYPILRTMNN